MLQIWFHKITFSPFLNIFLKICFNWGIITLQYYDCFSHTPTWIGHRYTCVSPSWNPYTPPSSPYPSRLPHSTGFGCRESHIKLTLVIYFKYGNVHVSILFSQIILTSPSPTESKSLFFSSEIQMFSSFCKSIHNTCFHNIQ